jgi:hypothetical protein
MNNLHPAIALFHLNYGREEKESSKSSEDYGYYVP